MSIFDSHEFITRGEYYECRDERLHPKELIVDELYSILFAFKKHPTLREKEAVKFPVLCVKPSFEDMGKWIINYNLVDDDLKPNPLLLWEKFKQDSFIDVENSSLHREGTFSEGYIKPFDDGLAIDVPMLAIEQSM